MDPNDINAAAAAELNAMRAAMIQMQTDRALEEEQRRDLIARVEGLLQEAGQAAAQSAAKSEQALMQSQLAHEASIQAAREAVQAANVRQQAHQPKGTIPKLDLMTYDGTGDLDRWHKRCRGVFATIETPVAKQATIAFLNGLRGVAHTYVDEYPLEEIMSWSFERLVEVLRARFELTIKQASHRQTWASLQLGKTENIEAFYDRFTKACHHLKPPVSPVDQYWRWYASMPDWVKDRLNMQMAEEGGTLGEAVVLTRKAMAGMTIAYGSSSRSDMQPPMDPNAPTAMEVNAMHKRERRSGGTDGRGRGKGDGRNDRRQQHGVGDNVQRRSEGKNGTNDGKGGKSGKSGKGEKDNPKIGACHNCGIAGHWARECRKKAPGKR